MLDARGPRPYTCASHQPGVRLRDEADVSAAQPPSQARSRVPRADAEQERPPRPRPPAEEGSPPPYRLVARSYAALKRRAEFTAVRRRGSVKARPTLLLYRLQAPGERLARAGITVDTRVGRAVVRNTVRRRIAAALQELLPAHPGERLLIVARPAAASANFQRIRSDLRSALEAA